MLSLHVCELVYALCWMDSSLILFHLLEIEWERVPSYGPTNSPSAIRC